MRSYRIAVASLLLVHLGCSDGSPSRLGTVAEPIIGGVPDTWRSYVVGVGDDVDWFCTGTVISKRTILTAGHCYKGNKPGGGITRVYFGNVIAVATNPATVTVDQAIKDPLYNNGSVTHDLALVHITSDAPSEVAPLLRETMDASFIGPDFSFVGYGLDDNNMYDVRRVVTFPIVAIGPDATVGLDTKTGPIDETMFYYRPTGKNTCFGDSGGPSFVARAGVERVAGTTSTGDAACAIDGVNQRTDAPAIASFIQPTLDLLEGNDACRSDGMCNDACNVGVLVDPDCAEQHCVADGLCVLSCVAPVDPDCAVERCGPDGACDPSCMPADPDCGGGGGGGAGGGGGGGGGAGTSSTAGTGGDASSTGTLASSSSSTSSASGAGGAIPRQAQGGGETDGGCGCVVAPRTGGSARLLILLAALGAALHRRVRRRRARTRRG